MAMRHRSAFGATLRHYREAAGLSQEELAERAGLSQRGISDLERGVRLTPRLETVRMLAAGLGLEEDERAALLAARAAHHEPAWSGAGRRRLDLPVPPTSFIGREPEITATTSFLMDEEARLVTLVGPGGIGKTRIALEVARRVAGEYGGDVPFVDLSPIRRPEFVLSAIAIRLGVPESRDQALGDVLAVALQDRRMLLVLDNLEQVVEAAPDIAALLAVCPGARILATSRVVLRLAAEHVVPIEPLPLPDGEETDVSALASIDSVALFVARARAADARFALTDANAGAIAAVVHRLDGLPLAIELAAARSRLFSPADLLGRLEVQLPVLAGGSPDAPGRHRTMRDTIRWSHDLLTTTEQADFRRLTIFPGGCSLDTAEAMLGALEPRTDDAILEGLASLVDSNLLRRREGLDGEMRYVMLEAVREYGLEQLQVTGEENMARDAAHAVSYMPLARESEFLMHGWNQVELLDRLEAEHPNIRHHERWLVARERIDDALEFSGAFWFFRWIRGHYAEARQQFDLLLAHPLAQARTAGRGRVLVGLGVIAAHQGDVGDSLEALGEAIDIFRELGEQRYLSLALLCFGTSHFFVGQIDEGEAATRESHAIAASIGDDDLVASGLTNLGVLAVMRGEDEEARSLLEESLRHLEATGNSWGVALGALNLGQLDIRAGALDRAESEFRTGLRLINELKDRGDLPNFYLSLAEVARLRGDLADATRLLEQALRSARDTGDSQAIASSLSGLARISCLRGDPDAALAHCLDAIHWYERSGDMVNAVQCLDTVADIARMMGDAGQAARCIGAVDGMLAARGLSRLETAPGEHQARIDDVKAELGEDGWHANWARGHARTPEETLGEIRAWRPARRPAWS